MKVSRKGHGFRAVKQGGTAGFRLVLGKVGYLSGRAFFHALPTDGRRLRVTARTADGEVMAVEHASKPVYGVQFHPESAMTPDGAAMIGNFLALASDYAKGYAR